MFKIHSTDGSARCGVLQTSHGEIQTPFFMPVATFGTGRGIGPQDYEDAGVQCTISNSFLLSAKPGLEVIKSFGNLSKFTRFKGCTFTDSGGFQSEGDLYVQTSNKGVHLKNPFDGKTHILNPKKVMENQNIISSDIAMVIDDMALPGSSKERFVQAMRRTHDWAKKCKELHKNSRQLLFCIVQGGYDADLRKQSAEYLSTLNFDGYAIGGCAIGEPKPDMYRAVKSAAPLLPENKPRYLMGVGSPPDIVQCVSLGIDCFDSIFPTMNARHNTIFTFKGSYLLNKGRFKKDDVPLEEGCDCWVCKKHSRGYLRHLSNLDEAEGKRLRQVHNIRFMMRLMEKIRLHIKHGTYESFRKKFLKDWFGGKVPKIYEP